MLHLQVIPNNKPDDWNLPSIYLISAVLGGIACVSSLALLYMGFDSQKEGSLLGKWGFDPIPYEEVVSMMYLKVSLALHFCTQQLADCGKGQL